MTDALKDTDEPIDVRLLARQDLPHEAFPGGQNEGLRVFFMPEVHAELWRHALADTTVEICGVLVGSWHRDQSGPFVKVVNSIRGDGAQTRFAEVTFTHETWAKINSEMDTKFTDLSIVGWYHTHPDFGIFLSDRDRFIHEHFFTGPGQIAHVIDPIRKAEGVFIWRNAKPSSSGHYWVGDRILAPTVSNSEQSDNQGSGTRARALSVERREGSPLTARSVANAKESARDSHPKFGRLVGYFLVFILGYLLANLLSAWEHQRLVESVLASNGFVAILRLGLADELDGLRGDLAAMVRPLESIATNAGKPEEQLGEIRAQLLSAARRTAAIKAQYANTLAEDELLKRMLRDRQARKTGNQLLELSDPEPQKTKYVETPAESLSASKLSTPETPANKTGDGSTSATDKRTAP